MIDITTLHKITIRIGEKTYTGYFSPNVIPKESLTNGLFGFGVADSANGYYRLTTAPGTFGTFLTKENILNERSSIDIDAYNIII